MLVFGLLCIAVSSVLTDGQMQDSGSQARSNRGRSNLRQYSARNAPSRFVRPPISNNNQQGDPANESFVPHSWRDLVRDIHDVDSFIRLLVTDSGRPVTDNDIFSQHETADGKRVITDGGILATSDECSPRNMSVRLPLDLSDAQVAYYPECTQVQRCGGCTPTPFLTCEPHYKEKIVLKVLRARYLYPGALSMRWEGFTSVEVERHLSCRAVCNLRAQDCRTGQNFNPYQCKCKCLRSQNCGSGKVWDDDNCSCRCANEAPCCADHGGEDDRTCTSFFDQQFCECTLKTSIGAFPNASQAEIEAWLESRRNRENGNPPLFSEPDATTTTPVPAPTTPTPAPTPQPCQQCPANFVAIINPFGRCVCLHRAAADRGRLRG